MAASLDFCNYIFSFLHSFLFFLVSHCDKLFFWQWVVGVLVLVQLVLIYNRHEM